MTTEPPAGWYPDPSDETKQRYWTGTHWAAPKQRTPRRVLIILGAAFAVGALVLGVTAWNDSRRPPAAEEVENPWDALQQWQVMQWSWDDLTPGAQETICQTYRSEPEKVWAVWDDTGNADGWVTRRQFEDFYGRKCS